MIVTSKTPRGTKQNPLWWNMWLKKLPELVKAKYLTNRKIRCATFTKIISVILARRVVTVHITTLSYATSIRLTAVTQLMVVSKVITAISYTHIYALAQCESGNASIWSVRGYI